MFRKFLICAVVFLCSSFYARAQWDVQFSDYSSLKAFYNPAVSGTDGLLNVSAAYSMQMVGFEGAPKTMFVGADIPIYFIGPRHGAGVSFMSDEIGMFKTQKFSLQYAYNFKIGKKARLAAGIQASMLTETFDPSDIELGDDSDPAFPTSSVDGSGFDLGAGLYFYHPNYWGGFSVQHIMSPKILLGESNEISISPMYYLMGGCNIKIKNTLLSLQPSFMVQSDFQSWREDITCKLTYDNDGKKFYGGLGYSPNTSFTVLLGGEFHGIALGYSYQVYTTGIGMQNGSHEIVLGYKTNLDLFKKGRNKHKSVRIL